jgi:rhodanese-related sulfurtransferase
MKRSELVKMLISEGMSEKTLVNFSDKQLSDLHERMVIDADKLKDPKLQAIANDPNIEVEVKEDLKGNQKKLDKNKPVLVYCAAGGRSASAAKDLKKAGFKKVYDLEGGYDAWKE